MSYDYKLAGNNFNRQQWNQKAADYFNSNGDQFVPITWNDGMPVTDPGDLSGSDLDGTQCWALPEGGIRGVGISPDELKYMNQLKSSER